MKKIAVVVAGVALAMVAGEVSTAFAQDAMMDQGNAQTMKRKVQNSRDYRKMGSAKYRPLTVSRAQAPGVAPAAGAVGAGAAVGGALAAPFNAVGAAGGPIGAAGSIAGGAVAGATGLAFAPLAGLSGAAPGISPMAAPPLPIRARYANTGKVFSTYDEGYAQDVPVDASGPIYKIDDKAMRTVTPFTLAAFPVQGVVYGATSPFRPAAQ